MGSSVVVPANSCESVAPANQCIFFRRLESVMEVTSDIGDCTEDSLLIGNIYIHLHSTMVECAEKPTPYRFDFFEKWVVSTEEIIFVSGYGVVVTEQHVMDFVSQMGYDGVYCMLRNLRLNGLLFEMPKVCLSATASKRQYILVPYSRSTWVDASLFCV